MNLEIENPVKIKIKSHKNGFDVTIKAKVIGSEAVPLTDMMIEQLNARGFKTIGEKSTTTETVEIETKSEQSIPICPTHHKELVKRKGEYGEFWACPSRDEKGNWCKWKPEKEKKKQN
jgi:hypothetical protein